MVKKTGVLAAVAASTLMLGVGVASAAADGVLPAALQSSHRSHGQPRNIIFLLGDGMGTQEITAARYYQGVHNKLNVDRMS